MSEEALEVEEEVLEPEETEAEESADVEEAGEIEEESDPIEERAKAMGWSPIDQWRGDPEKHVDAKTFVDRAYTKVPIMQNQLRRFEEDNKALRKSMQLLVERTKKADEDAYERAISHVRRMKSEAVAEGDSQKYESAERHMEQLLANKPKPIEMPEPEVSAEESPEFQGWVRENDWYMKDRDLQNAADTLAAIVRKDEPNLVGSAFFNKVAEKVRVAYPHKFSNQNRKKPPAVEGAIEGKKGGGKGYSDLPAEAKKACERFVKDGIMTKEQYVKDYWS